MSTSHKKQTFVFKTVSNLDLSVNIYLPNTPPSSNVGYPVVLYMHSGGLIIGDLETVSPFTVEWTTKRNWAFVSFNYRLAPEVKIDEIWSDCEDVYKWLLNDAARLAETKLDTDKIALYGLSAGGLLALIGGYKFSPRPKAIVNFCGSCGLMDPYYSTPKEGLDPAMIAPDSVKESILDHPISQYSFFDNLTAPRVMLFSYFIQKGTYIEQVIGLDVHNQSDVEKLISWTPSYNITSNFPPTFVGQGTKDELVPMSDPADVVQELKKHGVTYEFNLADGQGHAYDLVSKPGDEAWDKYVEPAFTFLEKHLQ